MSTKVLTSCIVTPIGVTPKHTIWLSNIDIRDSHIRYTPMIYVYKCNGSADFFSFEALKVGLAKTLVPFYPYAGRLGYNSDGRIQIECTGEGVLLIEASCDSTVDELGEFCPSRELHELVLPPESSPYPPCPVVKIQVTYRGDSEFSERRVREIGFLEEEKRVERQPLGFRTNELLVASLLSFPLYDADFGWGKPMVSGRASQDLPDRVYLKRANSSDREVVLTATFEVEVMDKFVEFLYTELKISDDEVV